MIALCLGIRLATEGSLFLLSPLFRIETIDNPLSYSQSVDAKKERMHVPETNRFRGNRVHPQRKKDLPQVVERPLSF